MQILSLYSMFAVVLLLTSCFGRSEGLVMEITSVDEYNVFIGPAIGANIDSCSAFTFQVKSCDSAHVWLGGGTSNGTYEIVIGGWSNTQTAFRDCDTCFSSQQLFSSPDVLGCDTFRNIWVSWGDGRIGLGRGRVPQEDVIFDIPDPNLHNIYTIGFAGNTNNPATFILGESGNSRFDRMVDDGKYTDGAILEGTVSLVNCSQQCHGHSSCGMFSYNDDLARCALVYYDVTAWMEIMENEILPVNVLLT